MIDVLNSYESLSSDSNNCPGLKPLIGLKQHKTCYKKHADTFLENEC